MALDESRAAAASDCEKPARQSITSELISATLVRKAITLPGVEAGCFEETVLALLQALKAKSFLTSRHSGRVARYAAAMAGALDFSEARIDLMERCGLLHDIGKLGISEEVLEKPGALTPEEWLCIKSHPEIGVQTLKPLRSLESVLPAVAMHHERFDGKGYPYGLAGLEIPLEARIISVCDAYDTMTSDRPYRKALVPDEALVRLKQGIGTQFDPFLVQAFAVQVFRTL